MYNTGRSRPVVLILSLCLHVVWDWSERRRGYVVVDLLHVATDSAQQDSLIGAMRTVSELMRITSDRTMIAEHSACGQLWNRGCPSALGVVSERRGFSQNHTKYKNTCSKLFKTSNSFEIGPVAFENQRFEVICISAKSALVLEDFGRLKKHC